MRTKKVEKWSESSLVHLPGEGPRPLARACGRPWVPVPEFWADTRSSYRMSHTAVEDHVQFVCPITNDFTLVSSAAVSCCNHKNAMINWFVLTRECFPTPGWSLFGKMLSPIASYPAGCVCVAAPANTTNTTIHCGSKKRANFDGLNYDPFQSILIIFSKLSVNDHKSCLVVKFSTSPHI